MGISVTGLTQKKIEKTPPLITGLRSSFPAAEIVLLIAEANT